MDQNLILDNLEWLSGSIQKLLGLIGSDGDYRPRERMRTLLELANHLVQIPAVDLLILKGGTQDEVRALEAQLTSTDPERLFQVWTEGVAALKAYYAPYETAALAAERRKAFYGHEATLAQWLLDILTHAYHHRAQLFTYLKELGRPIDMFILY
jgi:uncharacterized damage-inducible protein DinB